MNKPFISVVMPAFNAADYIQVSIESILQQTLQNIELVIVDDCSTDNTWDIICKLAENDKRIVKKRLLENSGSAKYPREIAVKMSKANLICWIDSDDIVEPDYLMKLSDRYLEAKEPDIVCSQMIAFENSINNIQYALPTLSLQNHRDIIIKGKEALMMTIGNWKLNANGFLVKKDLWLKTSTFLDGKSYWMDVDDVSTREMLSQADKVAFANANYYYRIHSLAITKKISPKRFETLLTDVQAINLITSTFGRNSNEAKLALNQYLNRILSFIRLYVINEKKLSYKDRINVLSMLKKHYSSCTISNILLSQLTGLHKLLMLLPFSFCIWIIRRINNR